MSYATDFKTSGEHAVYITKLEQLADQQATQWAAQGFPQRTAPALWLMTFIAHQSASKAVYQIRT